MYGPIAKDECLSGCDFALLRFSVNFSSHIPWTSTTGGSHTGMLIRRETEKVLAFYGFLKRCFQSGNRWSKQYGQRLNEIRAVDIDPDFISEDNEEEGRMEMRILRTE
uniref:Uncharacterized protein n=1 Tax=Ditylenchus dipsaci TaxID=166011 RepID=A0A915DDS6_9BILA